jgi:hypothetical protein
MSNYPDQTDNPRMDNASDVRLTMDWWFDQVVPGGRNAWRPQRILDPEHYIKWYLLFDFSSGKFSQSLALRGTYTSSGWQQAGFNWNYGYPVYDGSPYNQFFLGTGGGGSAASLGTMTAGTTVFSTNLGRAGGASSTIFVPFLTNMTSSNDNWNTTLRYTLSVPLVQRVAWLVTMNMNNPFNHRGIASGAFSVGGTANSTLVPTALTGTAVARSMAHLRQGGSGDQDLVWGQITDVNSQYVNRMGGRSLTVQTGLRF